MTWTWDIPLTTHIETHRVVDDDVHTIGLCRDIVNQFAAADGDKPIFDEYRDELIAVTNRGHRGFALSIWGQAPQHSEHHPNSIPWYTLKYDNVSETITYESICVGDPVRKVQDVIETLYRGRGVMPLVKPSASHGTVKR